MFEAFKIVCLTCLMLFIVVVTISLIAIFIEATRNALIKTREKRNQK